MLQAEGGESFWSRSLGMVRKSSAGAMGRCQGQTRRTMQVCALCCRGHLENFTQHKLA